MTVLLTTIVGNNEEIAWCIVQTESVDHISCNLETKFYAKVMQIGALWGP